MTVNVICPKITSTFYSPIESYDVEYYCPIALPMTTLVKEESPESLENSAGNPPFEGIFITTSVGTSLETAL